MISSIGAEFPLDGNELGLRSQGPDLIRDAVVGLVDGVDRMGTALGAGAKKLPPRARILPALTKPKQLAEYRQEAKAVAEQSVVPPSIFSGAIWGTMAGLTAAGSAIALYSAGGAAVAGPVGAAVGAAVGASVAVGSYKRVVSEIDDAKVVLDCMDIARELDSQEYDPEAVAAQLQDISRRASTHGGTGFREYWILIQHFKKLHPELTRHVCEG